MDDDNDIDEGTLNGFCPTLVGVHIVIVVDRNMTSIVVGYEGEEPSYDEFEARKEGEIGNYVEKNA
jgi:hypothetical protein